MGILEDILTRLERIEFALGTANQAPTPTQTMAPAPAPLPGVSTFEPTGIPYGNPPGMTKPAQTQVGPQAVPTLNELNELMLTLQEKHGVDVCLSLIRQHRGADDQGNASLSQVPAEMYLSLEHAIRQQLGVH